MSSPFTLLRSLAVAAALLGLSWSHPAAAPRQAIWPGALAPSLELRGDLDGDGVLDSGRIANATGIELRLSGGTGPRVLPLEGQAVGLLAVDVDRDGHLDVVATLLGGRMVVWLNDGHGHFAHRAAPAASTNVSSLRLTSLGSALSPVLVPPRDAFPALVRSSVSVSATEAGLRSAVDRIEVASVSARLVRGPPAVLL